MRKRKTKLKVKTKIKVKSEDTPNQDQFFAVMTLTLKPPRYSTEYFGKMSSETPVMDAWEEEHRCNIIMTQQEHDVQNQDTLEYID